MTSPRSYDGVGYPSPSFSSSSGTPIYDSLVAERGIPQIAPINVPPANAAPTWSTAYGAGFTGGLGSGFDSPASNLPALPPARLALGPGPSSSPVPAPHIPVQPGYAAAPVPPQPFMPSQRPAAPAYPQPAPANTFATAPQSFAPQQQFGGQAQQFGGGQQFAPSQFGSQQQFGAQPVAQQQSFGDQSFGGNTLRPAQPNPPQQYPQYRQYPQAG
ncbi:DUF6643 family protein [Kitasatospora sp. NPDC004615]|uniref:DUF6643 family protein n=1 Tax=unclassified Kitasatospora TaxID=2633591 RepID=UPI00367EF8C6